MKRKGEEFSCSPVVPSFFITCRLETTLMVLSLSKKFGFRLKKFTWHGWQADFSGYKFLVPLDSHSYKRF